VLLRGGLIKFQRGVWGYIYCHDCRLGPVALSPLDRNFLFPARVGFVFVLFLLVLFFVWVFVALRACCFRGFVSGHTGACVRRSGVAVCFGVLAFCVHFVIGNMSLCFIAFFCFFVFIWYR
jgi:hypothetical protein